MNRMHKWKYKRLELQTEKERLMNSLLSVSEDLMKFHSGLLASRCFDDMMGEPIKCIENWFKIPPDITCGTTGEGKNKW